MLGGKKWWIRPDLNRGPGDYESPAFELAIAENCQNAVKMPEFLFDMLRFCCYI